METVTNHECPRCGQSHLNIYFSNDTDTKIGAWCENCNLKAYFQGSELVSLDSYS